MISLLGSLNNILVRFRGKTMDCVTLMRACYMQMSLEQLNTMVCYYLRGCLIPTIQYSMPDVGGGGGGEGQSQCIE